MVLGRDDWTTDVDLDELAYDPSQIDAPSSGTPPRQPESTDTHPVPPTLARPRWQIRYVQWVAISDLMAMAGSLGLHKLWGASSGTDHFRTISGGALIVLTASALGLARAWDPGVLGQGSHEFNRLLRAYVGLAAVTGLIGYAVKLPPIRPYIFGVIPVAFILAAMSRLAMRKVLHRRRRGGACLHEVLAVGTEDAVATLITRTRRAPHNGWAVAAACTPSGTGSDGGGSILNVPVVGDLDSITKIALTGRYQVVSVAHAPGWSSQRLHHLAWDLEGTGIELVVDPGLMEIAGPRLHVAAVDGQPLLRLTEPAFTGLPRAIKTVCDRLSAIMLLVAIAPVMIAAAIAVASDGGPVFYRQSRVGKGGRLFPMIKFRSMVMGADRLRPELGDVNQGSGPLFKIRHDPRVTRIGRFLRKYSIDELPQLFNVLAGSMSLVGPRPPLPEELASYCRGAQRKLLVKPGLTGLWQISGRSDLSWEESVRLDLRYVENWSLALDILIIWKTIGAVVRGTGAY
jgi:exopolysaccharide biosynthesis polyprenyl glycosylphosphotransferase